MRWSTRQRIEFIETRLYWEGKISRKDLTGYFDISIPQATKDIKTYMEIAPANIQYDGRAKQYIAPAGFVPVLISPDSEAYLKQLFSSDAEKNDFFCGSIPPFYNVPCIQRQISPLVLKYVLRNIREQSAIYIEYQSMGGPGRRWITPHAIGFDGFRLHTRAFCHKNRVYKDFKLGRILDTGKTKSHSMDHAYDFEWFNEITFIIEPHPGLTDEQRKGIEIDYGMTNGRLEFEVKAAFVLCMQNILRLDEGHNKRDPQKQQIVLVNEEEIGSQCRMLKKMSAKKIEETVP
ncbi:MAG: WYL domain-containing protein [Desulfobacteraceae bacterium]|nr:WYL domain-containing protein [Desulfobacteraceae bacterium]